MAGRPRLLPITKKHLRQVLSVKLSFDLSDASTVVASRFKFAFILDALSRSPSFSHFDPFGTEFCVSRGGSAIRTICDFQFPIADLKTRKSWVSSSIGKSAIGNYKEPSNLRLNSWRPRANLDLTVPTLIPKVTAISS
jgi:hypothetical protein